VTDNEAPVITCPVIAQPLCNNNTGNYNIPALIASDNCGISSISYSIAGATNRNGSGNDASGNFATGSSVITWNVTDIHGLASSCSTNVQINPPVIAAIADVWAVSPGGNANTIYTGYGQSTLTLSVTATGGTAPYTYHWSNGAATSSIIVSAAGNYTVTVTDVYGCTVSVSKTISVVDVRCGNNNDKVLVCQVPPGNTGKPQTICIAASAVATHLANGSYLGTCEGNTYIVKAGSKQPAEVKEAVIMAYPNPSRGQFNLRVSGLAKGKVTIQVMDGNGKIVAVQHAIITYDLEDLTLHLPSLASGVYNVKLMGEKEILFTKVVIAK
jgi:hypothetical protein